MNQQLETWQSQFGKEYTDRNAVDWRDRLAAFRVILDGVPVRSVLEVGCNRGHNLRALRDLLGPEARVVGVEPNDYARGLAVHIPEVTEVLAGNAYDLPFADGEFDLVFTAGVLIHIPPDQLPTALAQIYRCSSRYVLAIEYFAEQATAITYRGQSDLLWKRDFLHEYCSRYGDLELLRTGYWESNQCHWWLLAKHV